jgi:hypothetical protein
MKLVKAYYTTTECDSWTIITPLTARETFSVQAACQASPPSGDVDILSVSSASAVTCSATTYSYNYYTPTMSDLSAGGRGPTQACESWADGGGRAESGTLGVCTRYTDSQLTRTGGTEESGGAGRSAEWGVSRSVVW